MFTVDKESLVLGIEYIESVISGCKKKYIYNNYLILRITYGKSLILIIEHDKSPIYD